MRKKSNLPYFICALIGIVSIVSLIICVVSVNDRLGNGIVDNGSFTMPISLAALGLPFSIIMPLVIWASRKNEEKRQQIHSIEKHIIRTKFIASSPTGLETYTTFMVWYDDGTRKHDTVGNGSKLYSIYMDKLDVE